MPNKIEIFEKEGNLVRARMLLPKQQVEVSLRLAPGDDPLALLAAEHTRLSPKFAGAHDAQRDLPALPGPVLQAFDGAVWSTP